MSDADEGPAAGHERGVEHVAVAAIGDVQPFPFQPVAQWVLPEQELPRPHRKGEIGEHGELGVGPVEAGRHAGMMGSLGMGVERVIVGPAVVGLPGVVRALEEQVRRPPVPDDEDHVALPVGLVPRRERSELAQIDSAGPVLGDLEFEARFPPALAQPIGPDLRQGLGLALQRPRRLHQTSAVATVVAHPVDVEAEGAGGFGADEDGEGFTGLDRLVGAIPFDVGATVASAVDPDAGQLPVPGAWLPVLQLDCRLTAAGIAARSGAGSGGSQGGDGASLDESAPIQLVVTIRLA